MNAKREKKCKRRIMKSSGLRHRADCNDCQREETSRAARPSRASMKLLAHLAKNPRKVPTGFVRHSRTCRFTDRGSRWSLTWASCDHPSSTLRRRADCNNCLGALGSNAVRTARALMKLLAHLGKNPRKTVDCAPRLNSLTYRCVIAKRARPTPATPD